MDEMRRGRTALDAVEAAVVTMEDKPTFNAGRGSSLTFSGTVEMDAAIMDGKNLSAGAVALLRDVENPVRLARIVMEKTLVLIAGGTAASSAILHRLAQAYTRIIEQAHPQRPEGERLR
jgi:beta-aspartyl-peptidase (threonine type)